ncbi:MAG: Asp-tRNA(Asn)/Glu-tRNA(Gln) amidotransferase subunit GatB, partial [Candidatus Goldbacteria bacterium]|nr:Asp-tRNA(Asn)/Glu-tRNA(Gln) amidotransferase subunit GatB [Candidatus Goldiibacteriota bacterium]
MNDKYEIVIGLEVHVELSTKSKAFCGCSTQFGAEPNTNICPVCLGLPGALPVINREMVRRAIKAGLALNCTIAKYSKFDRKNYYYPDLPKAYQISQYDMPIASNGYLEIVKKDGTVKKIGIKRLHMEEDAGKLLHLTKTGQIGEAESSLVDYNRAGVPLIEIVSEPDIRTSEEAYLYLTALKSIMKYIDVSDCNMEEGSLRCDANISVRKKGDEKLGVKVEIKNMNSFKNVQKALDYEAQRQIKMLESNETIIQETRLWDANKEMTFSMRSKEESHDYRYFPEPDLPPLEISQAEIEEIKKEIPELPQEKLKRFIKEYNLPEYDASILISDKQISMFYEDAVKISKEPKLTSNWIMTELLRRMNESNIEDINKTKITAENLGKLILLIKDGTISGKIAKMVFDEMFKSGAAPDTIVKEKGLTQITDLKEIEAIIDKVINSNQELVG